MPSMLLCLGRCFCSTVVSFWQNCRSKINYTVTRAQPNAPSHVVLVLPYQIFSLRTLFARDKYKKMALRTFHDIPNTILGDIFAHFDFNSNWFYRRVSRSWHRLLIRVFGNNHFAVDIPKLQQKVSMTIEEYSKLRVLLRASAQEWFATQKEASIQRNVFFYGHGEPHYNTYLPNELADLMQQCMDKKDCQPRWWMWANLRLTAEALIYMRVYIQIHPYTFYIPPTCRLLLKNCYVDGIDWVRLACKMGRGSLFCIPITEIEVVSIGNLNAGHITKRDHRYVFGEGEKNRFEEELLRLGRKYVKAMNVVERQILLHSLKDHYMTIAMGVDLAVNYIVKVHELSPENQQALLPDTLHRLVSQWKSITLDPLTERLLEALTKDHRLGIIESPIATGW